MADQDPSNNNNNQQAQQPTQARPQQQNGGGKKYFRTSIAGLSLVVGAPKEGEVAPQTVRFTPIMQRWEGEMQKFGYLATSNKKAIQMCSEDPNVVSIDQDEYDKVMEKAEDASEPNVRRVA